ncbi:hypothetical protein BdWA1_000133 [Babesia duncani]|uniref:Secreted protein n=1 Tax=Babesia duncani TaxID=323732 RepID=A0AAD9PLU4_9APIC|nr:hypothetical protein BdWA1_000133 [Babesia duncani]
MRATTTIVIVLATTLFSVNCQPEKKQNKVDIQSPSDPSKHLRDVEADKNEATTDRAVRMEASHVVAKYPCSGTELTDLKDDKSKSTPEVKDSDKVELRTEKSTVEPKSLGNIMSDSK